MSGSETTKQIRMWPLHAPVCQDFYAATRQDGTFNSGNDTLSFTSEKSTYHFMGESKETNIDIWKPSEMKRMRLELRREIFQCRAGTEEAHAWLADGLDTEEDDHVDNFDEDVGDIQVVE